MLGIHVNSLAVRTAVTIFRKPYIVAQLHCRTSSIPYQHCQQNSYSQVVDFDPCLSTCKKVTCTKQGISQSSTEIRMTRKMSGTSKPTTSSSKSANGTFRHINDIPSSTNSSERPVIVLLPWLGAKPKHIGKFIDFYHKRGYDDVVSTSITPSHFLWPSLSHAVTDSIVKELRSNDYANRRVIVHSFSIGTFVLSVLFKQMIENPQAYADITKRMIGFVGDSLTIGGPRRMANGVVEALTTSNTLQTIGKASIMTYFNLTQPWTLRIYEQLVDAFHNIPVPHAPNLYFYCHNDPMCDPDHMEELIDYQRKQGIEVYSKDWQESRHAMHFVNYNKEYVETLTEFLLRIDPDNRKLLSAKL